jgi:hypothetical protein
LLQSIFCYDRVNVETSVPLVNPEHKDPVDPPAHVVFQEQPVSEVPRVTPDQRDHRDPVEIRVPWEQMVNLDLLEPGVFVDQLDDQEKMDVLVFKEFLETLVSYCL